MSEASGVGARVIGCVVLASSWQAGDGQVGQRWRWVSRAVRAAGHVRMGGGV